MGFLSDTERIAEPQGVQLNSRARELRATYHLDPRLEEGLIESVVEL